MVLVVIMAAAAVDVAGDIRPSSLAEQPWYVDRCPLEARPLIGSCFIMPNSDDSVCAGTRLLSRTTTHTSDVDKTNLVSKSS